MHAAVLLPAEQWDGRVFVKMFKRNYVYLAELDDALSVMRQLGERFEDYNEEHPNKGLGIRSPRAFRRAWLTGCPVRFDRGNSGVPCL